jgi:hypothetical protein
MPKKVKLRLFDILIAITLIVAFVWGITQVQNIVVVISLTALMLSGFNFYFSVYRPRYLLRPHLQWEPNVQISPPTEDEIEIYGAGISWFLRLKIVNNGLTPAKNCIGRLIEVRDGNNRQFDRFDPFSLYWMRQNDLNPFTPVDIQGNGDFFFLDIAQVKETDKDNPIDLRIVTPGGRLVIDSNVGHGSKLPPGIYHLCIAIYSEEDMYKEPTWFTMTCDTNFSVDCPPTIGFK